MAKLRTILWRILSGSNRNLRPYEDRCIATLRDSLPAAGREILDDQLRSMGVVQRFSQDKLVVFHFFGMMKNFPNLLEEQQAAKIELQRREGQKYGECRIVFHNGHLSSLEFSKPPTELATGFEIGRVTTLVDMMMPEAETRLATPPEIENLESYLSLTQGQTPLLVKRPVSESVADQFFNDANTCFPPDYKDLVLLSNGFQIGEWEFYGLNIRRIVLPARTYLVLAERLDGTSALCCIEGADSPEIVLYDQINEEQRRMGRVFIPALKKVVTEPQPNYES